MKPELEVVQLDGGHSIRNLHFRCTSFQDDHSWHFHPEYEITYIVKGSGTRFIGDSIENFQTGDLIFIGPGVPHCWISDESESENEMMVVQFNPLSLGQSFLDMPEAAELSALLFDAKRGIKICAEAIEPIHKSMQDISSNTGLLQISCFIRLLGQICNADETRLLISEQYLADNSDFQGGRLGKVMQYVNENIANEIKQAEVAELIYMTPQSFSRFFKATTGRTFITFVNILRITKASKRLVSTDNDIIDIAMSCGYSAISNFNRQFSAIKHCTPTEYRNSHKFVP